MVVSKSSSIYLLVCLLGLMSCSKSTPYVEEVVVETTYLRTWDEQRSVEAIVVSESISNAVDEIESNRKQGFDWTMFWEGLESELPRVKASDFKSLAILSGLECREANSTAYLMLMKKLRSSKRLNTNAFIEVMDQHIQKCGEFYSQEIHNIVNEIVEIDKELIDPKIYSSFIKGLYRKTSLVDIYDTRKVINEDILRKSLNENLKEGAIADFLSLSGIYSQIYPQKEMVNDLELESFRLENIDTLVKTNKLKSIIHLLSILPEKSIFEDNQTFIKMAKVIKESYLDEKFEESSSYDIDTLRIKYRSYYDHAVDALYLLASLAKTNEQKIYLLKMADHVIKKMVNEFEPSYVLEELNSTTRIDYFTQLVKEVFSPERKAKLSVSEDMMKKMSFFDQINIQLLKVRNQQDTALRHKEVASLCRYFSDLGAENIFSKIEDSKAIGCSHVDLPAKDFNDLRLSFYSVYKYHRGDFRLRTGFVSGGIFDLSVLEDKANEMKRLEMGQELDGILIPFLFKVKLAQETTSHYTVMPYIYVYQDDATIEFSYSSYERPQKGRAAGSLILQLEQLSQSMPILVSLGGSGQKSYKAPKHGKDHQLSIDEEHLELNLPFEASLLDGNLRSNRNMKIAFKNMSEKKYYSWTSFANSSSEEALDLLPNFQQTRLKKDLAYINEQESFGCGNSDYECVLLKLYPSVVNEINTIFEMNLSEVGSHELFDLEKLAKGLTVKENDVDGEKGGNGEIIIE